MKVILFFFTGLFFLTGIQFCQDIVFRNFIVVNWTDEEFAPDDIRVEYEDDSTRYYSLNQSVEEYSAKNFVTQNNISRILTSGPFSSPIVSSRDEGGLIVHRESSNNLTVSFIRVVKTKQIVGLNICDREFTFGRIRQFIIANFTNRKLKMNSITYEDSTQTGSITRIVQTDFLILPDTIALYPIETVAMPYNYWEFVQGRKVTGYTLIDAEGSSETIPYYDLKYSFIKCSYNDSGEGQQMLAGVEISNSGKGELTN